MRAVCGGVDGVSDDRCRGAQLHDFGLRRTAGDQKYRAASGGSLVGVSITAATFSSLSSTLVPVGLLLLSYWTVNGLYSGICKRTKLLDLKSAMFASAPGGGDGHVADRRRSGRGSLADRADPGAARGVCRRGDAAADPRFYPVDRIAERKGKR